MSATTIHTLQSGAKSPDATSAATTASTLVEEPSAPKALFIPGASRPVDAAAAKKTKKRKPKKRPSKQNSEEPEGSVSTISVTTNDAEPAAAATLEDPKFTDDLKELLVTAFPEEPEEEPEQEKPLEQEDQKQEDSVIPFLTSPGDPITELLNRRLRTVQKRKLRIDKISQAALSGKTLNADQEASLKDKSYVEGMLKELTDAWDANNLRLEQQRVAAEKEKAAQKEQIKDLIIAAKDLGIQQGDDKIFTLIRFLRTASIKRQLAAQNLSVTPQSAGFEALLQQVYNGDESSIEAVTKLYAGAEDLVAEDTVSFKVVRDISRLPEDVILAGGDVEEEIEEAQGEPATEDQVTGEEEVDTAAQGVSQISFLQESELDEGTSDLSTVANTVNTSAPLETDNSTVGAAPVESVTVPTTSQSVESANEPTVANPPVTSSPADTPTAEEHATPTSEEIKPKKKKNNYYRRNRNNNNNNANANSNTNTNAPKVKSQAKAS